MLAAEVKTELDLLLPSSAILTAKADCWPYGYDNSRLQAQPDAVVFPTEHAEIVALVDLCHRHGIPLISRGYGTGTTGATVPVTGGIILSMERMNRIIEVRPEDRYAVVEPGVTNKQLQDCVAEHGFFWPPDPTSAAFCSIGGNLAYNSAGPRAVKYGTPRDNTLGLTAVTGEGKTVRTGVYTTKGVVGYDLTRLLIGSEGTLAVITQAILKLTPLAKQTYTLRALYRDVHAAAAAVSRIMSQPIIPCALEFIDGQAIQMIRDYSKADLPQGSGAMLMIEVDGDPAGLKEQMEAVGEAANVEGILSLHTAETQAEKKALWDTRKALSPALRSVAPKKINEDVVVPVSKLPELIENLERLGQQYGITIVNFGHAGNGNIHVNLLIDPADSAQSKAAEACLEAVFDLVLGLRGTLSGEHGIGLVKREFVHKELDETALSLMHGIKQTFDPKGILNPGKMF